VTAAAYWLVVPAAGSGRRMGAAAPKQYLPLAGATVLEHALAPFLADPRCRGIVVALAADDERWPTLAVARDARVRRVTGGAERRDSVLAGLEALIAAGGAADDWVLVHDAARPCLRAADLDALLAALPDAPDGALLAVPLADTLKRADEAGRSAATVDRRTLWRAMTPQAAPLALLRDALARTPDVTDEASALEALGRRPRLVACATTNVKVTEPADLEFARRVLAEGGKVGETRIGFGVDVHAFGPGDHVWLGGVRIAYSRGVVAHSDGDVLLHALCDALLGAAGLGDIGQHFPDTDARWKGASSTGLLAHCVSLARERGWAVENADLTLLAEAPRVGPHRDAIRAHVAGVLGVPPDAVNVKATTTEKLGFLGRAEGLAAQAAVLLKRA
jgi:2-C-methyl-D-erythritol 4-phosphate cytidylyltransferase/2-C-methyl-D-erythritol 2,4-cyclodiphosphate synthase